MSDKSCRNCAVTNCHLVGSETAQACSDWSELTPNPIPRFVHDELQSELAAMQAERDALKQGKQLYADELNKLCQQSKQMILEKGNLVDRVATLETACRAILPFVEEDLDGMETYATGAYKAAIEQLQAALGKDGG